MNALSNNFNSLTFPLLGHNIVSVNAMTFIALFIFASIVLFVYLFFLRKKRYSKPSKIFACILLSSFFLFMIDAFFHEEERQQGWIALLERGKITQGLVNQIFFQHMASSGWAIRYKFEVEKKTFKGSAQGPKDYYTNFNKNDTLDIIYDPSNPENNKEVFEFLNRVSIVNTFKKTNRYDFMIAKFGNKYEIKDYTDKSWYHQQRIK